MDKEQSVSKNGNSAWVQVPSPALFVILPDP
jgi:hypothetical protein